MNELEWQLLEDKAPLAAIPAQDGEELRCGDHVRLRPRAGADIMDLALAGKNAVVESILQDYDGVIQLGVVLEDDPGADIGNLRQPGHRFFFRPEEVEPVRESAEAAGPRVLVAGIGNIFSADDGFGVEVVSRIEAADLPAGAQVTDFGIRAYDLALALSSGRFDAAILVDAAARGGAPGTLYVIQPETDQAAPQPAPANAHLMTPESVLAMSRTLGALPDELLIVACEPESLGGEDGHIGLSNSVEASVERAVELVRSLAKRLASGKQIGNE